MERLVKGDVVIIPFPFSNLKDSKRRPALVIGDIDGDDVILCQITSQARSDRYSIMLDNEDFRKGGLHVISHARPNRLFTADRSIIIRKVGSLNKDKYKEIAKVLHDIIG